MLSVSERTTDGFLIASIRFRTCLVVLFILLARMPPMAGEETDCRDVSGYTTGSAPDTCTMQLTLNDAEAAFISSLKAKYQDFPLKCRLRKYNIVYKL